MLSNLGIYALKGGTGPFYWAEATKNICCLKGEDCSSNFDWIVRISMIKQGQVT